MERNNIIEKKAVRRPRRVLEYWRGLILNLKTNMNFGTARNYRNSLYRFSEFLDRHDIAFLIATAELPRPAAHFRTLKLAIFTICRLYIPFRQRVPRLCGFLRRNLTKRVTDSDHG